MRSHPAAPFARRDGSGCAIAAPKSDEVPALIALMNALAAERSHLFILPVDPVAGLAGLQAYIATIAASGLEAVLVAHDDGVPVGLATGARGAHPARRGTVDIGLGVHEDHRGRGIGRALLLALEHWARSQSCHRLQLRVVTGNAPAIALYRSLGFTVEGVLRATALVDGGTIDELQMAKLL